MIMPDKQKNILIIKPSALGDIVLALPVLSALRKGCPNIRISWLVRPEFAPLLENHPDLDEIIIFDRKFLGKWWCSPKRFAALVSLIRKLRSGNFDAVLDLQGLFRTAVLPFLAGCKKRFGMATAAEFAPIFYNIKVSTDPNSAHLVDYYLKIARAAGASDTDVEFKLTPAPESANWLDDTLTKNKINRDNYVVFVTGAAHDVKRWPVEYFAALADKISASHASSIIAVGTDKEKTITQKLKSLAKTDVADFTSQTNITQLIALLSKAALVISNDTGPGHIAAALGVPLVMIFGPTNPGRVAPYKKENAFAAIEPEKRGTNVESWLTDHRIEVVSVDLVYENLCRQLKT